MSNLNQLKIVDVRYVTTIINESPTKQCALNPLQTWLTKDCVTILEPYVTDIINQSITTGFSPSAWKHAIISPLIKKSVLDDSAPSNYRPVSNLPFLSKVLERVISRQTIAYLDEHNLLPEVQSAHRRGHSTETTLLRVFSDLVDAMDEGSLSLLDLSAVLDAVGHDILQMWLTKSFGISRRSLQWFVSYHTDRTQSVCMTADSTMPRKLKTGVPQGSVLGQLLFTLYPSVKLFVQMISSITATPTIIKYMHHVRLLTTILLNWKSLLASEISLGGLRRTVLSWFRQSPSFCGALQPVAITSSIEVHFIYRTVTSSQSCQSGSSELILTKACPCLLMWIDWSARHSTIFDGFWSFDDQFRHPLQYNSSAVLLCRGSTFVTAFWSAFQPASRIAYNLFSTMQCG